MITEVSRLVSLGFIGLAMASGVFYFAGVIYMHVYVFVFIFSILTCLFIIPTCLFIIHMLKINQVVDRAKCPVYTYIQDI